MDLATRRLIPSRPQGALPERGAGAEAAVADYLERFGAFHTRSTGPRYFGFVTGGVAPAALAADWLVSTFDQNVATERHSIAAGIEAQAIHWMTELLELPADRHDGLFTTGATGANLACLATAREWAGERAGVDVADDGVPGGGAIRLVGCCPHSSVVKVAGILGIGRRRIERAASLPGREAIDPDALDAMLAAFPDRAATVCASAGTVDTGDFDDLAALASICSDQGAWLHVDAAFGAFLRTDPERRALVAGLELADSLAVDCHKWLNVPYDCGLALTRSVRLNERAFTADAPYVPGGWVAPDCMNRGLEQARRFRALPVWMALAAAGRSGVADAVRRNCDFARELGRELERSGRFRLVAPVRANVACFRPLRADGLEAPDATGAADVPVVLDALLDAHACTVEASTDG